MQIWDTAGQERFKTITQTYYKGIFFIHISSYLNKYILIFSNFFIGSMGVILTYAVDDRDSFNNIENWMRQIKSQASESICKILVGNKADVSGDKRKVTYEEGKKLAENYGIEFYETSAKKDDQTSNNVNIAFHAIAKEIKEKILVETPPMKQEGGNVNLNSNKTSTKKKECC